MFIAHDQDEQAKLLSTLDGDSCFSFTMSSMQQRKAEILAKRAKLSELKRQRELRQHEFNQTRANSGDASEVNAWVGP